ncbi:hypothetical protein ACHQM5_014973 [Ranunculus cassubicifolius]
MDFRSGVLDVSSFFLVESSGDSEGEFDSIVSMSCDHFAMEDENDAESCCSGSFDVACMNDVSIIDVNAEYDRGEDDIEEDDDGEYDSSISHKFDGGNWIWKSKVGEDLSEEMSEEEENKLFWDTCLAQ